MNDQELIREILSWPAEDRLRLIDVLWESLEDAPGAPTLTASQQLDLRRRLDAHRHDPGAGPPWEEVRDRLRRGGGR